LCALGFGFVVVSCRPAGLHERGNERHRSSIVSIFLAPWLSDDGEGGMELESKGQVGAVGGLALFAAIAMVSLLWRDVTPAARSSLWSMLTSPSYEASLTCDGGSGSRSVTVTALSKDDAAAYLGETRPDCRVTGVELQLDD
jgi:hypothetical protein